MEVTNLWSAGQPTVSFELFPPRSPKGAEKLAKTIDALAALRPDFVSVTFGAGGSTREGSRQLVEKLKKEKMLEVVAYFYDNRYFFDFAQRCRALGIDVPILAGVMPIYSVKMMKMLAGMCGATITEEVRNGIASLPEDDKEALVNFGIEFAVGQCKELLEAGVPGLHFYTMDLSKSTTAIVNRLRDDRLL